ncbi:MAG: type III pantothenate kinase [Thermogemmatispora sp.]|uniref:type III pantothenate kinase n=1 Tax=Thermogemmatispora sp. TaxID=1968838 RepID=UPI0019EB68B6|nr:type III pantothenate kinase [Thermogemmatispora sp.]MBE3565815.1 type III pantothenate kinase [Thermogemmatispora sp.]
MILALDIGNTNTVLGVYAEGALVAHWRIATDHHKTADEYGLLLRNFFALAGLEPARVEGVAIACVVPPVLETFEQMARRYFGVEPLVVGPGIKTGIPIRYENPKEVGADRIVNAVAGFAKYGGPLIIVDFGTATTFDAVSERGEYLGGAIAPGIVISLEALFERAARLPRVELVKPRQVIGRTTNGAMQAGIIYGTVGQVNELVRRMKAELGGEARVVATGGLAEVISSEAEVIEVVEPFLTLEGLRLIYELNRKE